MFEMSEDLYKEIKKFLICLILLPYFNEILISIYIDNV